MPNAKCVTGAQAIKALCDESERLGRPTDYHVRLMFTSLYSVQDEVRHGRSVPVISGRGGRDSRGGGYLNLCWTPTSTDIYDPDTGERCKFQMYSHQLFMFLHLYDKIQDDNDLTPRERIWYDDMRNGQSYSNEDRALAGRQCQTMLTVSHLDHSDKDVMELTIETWAENRARSDYGFCFDCVVCVDCNVSVFYCCTHTPKCISRRLGRCANC